MIDCTKPKLLVLDDDRVWLDQVPVILEDDCEVLGLETVDQGLAILESQSFDLILLDLNFANDMRTGLDVFRRIHATGCGADVIVISGETQPERLCQVFNAGVTRFISKPASPERVRQEVRKVLSDRESKRLAMQSGGPRKGVDPFIGSSSAIQQLRASVDTILQGRCRDLLIQGETGTGKEVLARAIAARWDRSGRFLPVHCGAIADGLIESELFGHVKGAFTGADRDRAGVFEAAIGGVVFLDEIGEMPLHQQPKLLRVLQDRKVQRVGTHDERPASFRAISATHVDLKRAVEEKRFREDLYYRIAQSSLVVPALRERLEDLPELVAVFLRDESGKAMAEIADSAIQLLASYDWPGNLRQLEAVVRNLAYRSAGQIIRERDVCRVLPEVASRSGRPGLVVSGRLTSTLVTAERRRFEQALIKANGYRDEAARALGLSRATFFRRAKDLGLIRSREAR